MGKKKSQKRKAINSPPNQSKSVRRQSPLVGLSVDPRLSGQSDSLSSVDVSELSMENQSQTSPAAMQTAPNLYSTPPGIPRPPISPNAATRPAYGPPAMPAMPDQSQFASMSDSDKLNFIYMQNSVLIAGQNQVQNILIRMLQNQETQLKVISEQMQLQQQSMAMLQNQLTSINRQSIASAFFELQEDREEREEKKTNLVLYGLAEPTENDAPDVDLLKNVFTAAGADPDAITDVHRLGQKRVAGAKPRPVKILTSSYEAKMAVLKGQKEAMKAVPDFAGRSDRPFFRPDQTRLQRQEDFRLRSQLKEVRERNPGTEWLIVRGEIVSRRGNI